MRRVLPRLGALLVYVTGLSALGAAPALAAPGFDLNLTELPGRFRAGAGPERVSAVVSTTNDDGCRKVRWSLLLRVEGLSLNQVRVERIEQNRAFPVRVSVDGNLARITDNQLDPGTLCRGRTVTAQYRVAIAANAANGRITFTPEAYDVNRQLLARTSATREVVGDRSRREPADRAERRPTPPARTTAPPAGEPADDDETAAEATGEESAPPAGAGAQPGAGAERADATAATSSSDGGLVTVGFVTGGLMLFLGVGLLLRLRQRMAEDDELAADAGPSGRFRSSPVRAMSGRGLRTAAPGRRRRRPSTVRY